jgi:cell division protein FtsB
MELAFFFVISFFFFFVFGYWVAMRNIKSEDTAEIQKLIDSHTQSLKKANEELRKEIKDLEWRISQNV